LHAGAELPHSSGGVVVDVDGSVVLVLVVVDDCRSTITSLSPTIPSCTSFRRHVCRTLTAESNVPSRLSVAQSTAASAVDASMSRQAVAMIRMHGCTAVRPARVKKRIFGFRPGF
jgi:hypothetical protein